MQTIFWLNCSSWAYKTISGTDIGRIALKMLCCSVVSSRSPALNAKSNANTFIGGCWAIVRFQANPANIELQTKQQLKQYYYDNNPVSMRLYRGSIIRIVNICTIVLFANSHSTLNSIRQTNARTHTHALAHNSDHNNRFWEARAHSSNKHASRNLTTIPLLCTATATEWKKRKWISFVFWLMHATASNVGVRLPVSGNVPERICKISFGWYPILEQFIHIHLP